MTDDELRRLVVMVPIYSDDENHAYHIRLARAVLAAYGAPATPAPPWDGRCVLGHCGSPSGCEGDARCRADDNATVPSDERAALAELVAAHDAYDAIPCPNWTTHDPVIAKARAARSQAASDRKRAAWDRARALLAPTL